MHTYKVYLKDQPDNPFTVRAHYFSNEGLLVFSTRKKFTSKCHRKNGWLHRLFGAPEYDTYTDYRRTTVFAVMPDMVHHIEKA
jgi:hypothetical protein